jgi:hypothetical protein
MRGKLLPVGTKIGLPALPAVDDIQSRLAAIFPEAFPDRSILVGVMAARVIFVCLYGDAIEGSSRYMRPSHVYLFTEEQSQKTDNLERLDWIANASRQGFRPAKSRFAMI